jgi:hypothetical protein
MEVIMKNLIEGSKNRISSMGHLPILQIIKKHSETYMLSISVLSFMLFSSCNQQQGQSNNDSETIRLIPPVISISVDENQFFLPDSIMEGWNKIHFVNKGYSPHIGQLIKLNDNKTLEEYLNDFTRAFQTDGERPPYATRIGGAGATMPQDTITILQYFEPGRHVIGDILDMDGTPNMIKGLIAEFEVIARSNPVEFVLPEEALEIILVDYAYGFKDQINNGKHWIKVSNIGVQPHETGIVRLNPGKTLGDFHKWRADRSSEPPFDLEFASGMGAIAKDRNGYIEVEFKEGKHVFFCFVTAPDGRGHDDHGMVSVVDVE